MPEFHRPESLSPYERAEQLVALVEGACTPRPSPQVLKNFSQGNIRIDGYESMADWQVRASITRQHKEGHVTTTTVWLGTGGGGRLRMTYTDSRDTFDTPMKQRKTFACKVGGSREKGVNGESYVAQGTTSIKHMPKAEITPDMYRTLETELLALNAVLGVAFANDPEAHITAGHRVGYRRLAGKPKA